MKSDIYSPIKILEILSSVNSAPYYESQTSKLIINLLAKFNIPFFKDDFGNIIAHYKPDKLNKNINPIAFVAHMDHPGFEAISYNQNNELEAKPLGGVPLSSLKSQNAILIKSAKGDWVKGIIKPANNNTENKIVYVDLNNETPIKLPAPIVFDLKKFFIKDNIIYMRAIDDLAGCSSILSALCQIAENKIKGNLYLISGTMIEANSGHLQLDCGSDFSDFNEKKLLAEYNLINYYDFQGTTWCPQLIHKNTWNNFTKFVLWGTVAVILVLVLMAIFLL